MEPVESPTPDESSRCSVRSLRRHDSLVGTALPAHRFLLVEDPGQWGRDPHPTGSLPAPVASHALACARELGARLLLIRRPGRQSTGAGRHWAVADVLSGVVRGGRVADIRELVDVDLRRDGTESQDPTYLVCTQGRHDVCCAVEGRPVAAALAAMAPAATWECSHVGGDRFAANVVALPSGLVYGRVTVDDVEALLATVRDGVVLPRLLRGRCGVAPVGQVAEAHVREAWSEMRMGAVIVSEVEHLGHDVWRVSGRHAVDSRVFSADLREHHDAVPRGLTCAAEGPGSLRTWTLVHLDLA